MGWKTLVVPALSLLRRCTALLSLPCFRTRFLNSERVIRVFMPLMRSTYRCRSDGRISCWRYDAQSPVAFSTTLSSGLVRVFHRDAVRPRHGPSDPIETEATFPVGFLSDEYFTILGLINGDGTFLTSVGRVGRRIHLHYGDAEA